MPYITTYHVCHNFVRGVRSISSNGKLLSGYNERAERHELWSFSHLIAVLYPLDHVPANPDEIFIRWRGIEKERRHGKSMHLLRLLDAANHAGVKVVIPVGGIEEWE